MLVRTPNYEGLEVCYPNFFLNFGTLKRHSQRFGSTYNVFSVLVHVMYSGETEYDACDVTLSVNPHRASLKNMPGHGGNKVILQSA